MRKSKAWELQPNTFNYWQDSLGPPPDCAHAFGRVSYPRSIQHISALPKTCLEGWDNFHDVPLGFSQCSIMERDGSKELKIYPEAAKGYFTATLAFDDTPGQLLQSVLDLKVRLYSVDMTRKPGRSPRLAKR